MQPPGMALPAALPCPPPQIAIRNEKGPRSLHYEAPDLCNKR